MVPPPADIIIVKHVLLRWLEIHTGSLDNRETTLFFLPLLKKFTCSLSPSCSPSYVWLFFPQPKYSDWLQKQEREARGMGAGGGGEGSSSLTFSLIDTT